MPLFSTSNSSYRITNLPIYSFRTKQHYTPTDTSVEMIILDGRVGNVSDPYLTTILLTHNTETGHTTIREPQGSHRLGRRERNLVFLNHQCSRHFNRQPRPNNYWKVLKNRLKKEGNETVTNCNRLKLPASDGKMRFTDVADTEQLFRLIQSIPSHKDEPFKQWMTQVTSDRLDQMQDPELSIQQAMTDYKRLGYSDN